MATAQSPPGCSPEEDLIALFQQQAHRSLLLCRWAHKTTRDETEYARLLSQILERLLFQVQRLQRNARISNAEQWFEQARSFLAQLDAKLVSNDSRAVIWQLASDDVTHFVKLSDSLWMHLRPVEFGSVHSPPSTPPELFINKLHRIRDRLFPPPQLGPWVELSRLRRWLDHCDTHHTAHCQLSPRSEQIFSYRPRRLIDVKRMCLVSCEPWQRYAALSYVWGAGPAFMTLKRNIEQLQQERSLSTETWCHASQTVDVSGHLPRTIRGVMELTGKLGEQYLWVDSLCIVQDDDDEKQDELARMGSIYANAYVTIVAAGGTAFCGLRGIENATPPMARASGTPYYLGHGREDYVDREIRALHRRLQASAWSHRAWTFQEQIFSRRLLVLDHVSVAWECHCAVWLEGMEAADGQCQNNRAVVAQGLSFSVQPKLSEYARHVAQFNHRALTYPEDALDAFGGILTTLSSTAFVGSFICGLPVLFFDAALLWYNKLPLERRRIVRRQDVNAGSASSHTLPPSWAWAAWGGAVDFPDHERNNEDDSGDVDIRPLVQWKYRESGKEPWQLISSVWGEQWQGSCAESEELASPVAGGSSRSAGAGGHDTEASDANIRPFAIKTGSHLLLSHPLRAFFRVMGFFGEVQILLADESDNCTGMLASCEALRNNETGLSHLLCEVVAISESFVNGEDTYNVLWIEWKDGIAYRKGVGRILKSVWEAHETERIQLVLG
ncbi:HET-domain-containing protein [Parachaetomium inaequale]|uniref:HET-domain-containing protein n=1 Tax=Parachaetomium inaequale TaxID=2588326 RepID=A0AAN6SPP0_9PEZI|nr:HET-domain-containing protein [Parachaetomium inaequale]